MMNPSSADSPRQPDNSSRKQQRSSSPAGLKDSGSKATQKGSNSSKPITSKQGGGGGGGGRSSRGHSPVSTGRERQAGGAPAIRGAAAVQAAGAESPTLSRPAAAADRGGIQTPEDSTRLVADASRADPSRVVSDQPCASKSPKLRSKNPRGGEAATATSGSKKSSKSTAGCGPGFWKEGCLQSELIQFHLNKSLGKKGTKMQAKSASSPASEPELSPEPDSPQPAPQADQRLQEEIEKLEDENEDLKVKSVSHYKPHRICLYHSIFSVQSHLLYYYKPHNDCCMLWFGKNLCFWGPVHKSNYSVKHFHCFLRVID